MSNIAAFDKGEELLSVNDEATDEDGDQYLTFIMAGDEYGVDILSVQEIRGWEEATIIPNAPRYLKGVINLRGTIVPLVDLRARFGIKETEYDETTVVIILRMQTDAGERIAGIVVDAVSEVYNIREDEIKTDAVGEKKSMRFVKGLATANEKMIVVLKIDNLLDFEE